jgi:hypothetical protein
LSRSFANRAGIRGVILRRHVWHGPGDGGVHWRRAWCLSAAFLWAGKRCLAGEIALAVVIKGIYGAGRQYIEPDP